MPAARIFLQLIADFVVYLGLVIRPRKAIAAENLFLSLQLALVTASFRVLYIFVIIEHASRRLLHWNVTSNPTAAWTLQQLREAIASDHPYRFLVHDRDSICAQALDTSIANCGSEC